MSVLSFDWLLWMSGTVAVFWLSPPRWRDLVLMALSAVFMVSQSVDSAIWLALFTAGTYALTRNAETSGRRTLAIGGVVAAVLIVYKVRVGEVWGTFASDVVMPLGMSYYALRCIHYAIERYKGSLRDHGWRDYVGYLLFLPTFAAGPIHRFPGFLADRRRHRWSAEDLSTGLERIVYGYAKIVILGNFLVMGYATEHLQPLAETHPALFIYLTMMTRAVNLYFQFSGYSDIAIGFSRLLGFRIVENFNWPFFAPNISEFWRRWHMSLTTWVRDYVYGTIVATTRSPALAVLGAMLIIGLWHEVSFRFLLWGVLHGVAIVVWQMFQKVKPRLPAVRSVVVARALYGLSVLATFNFFIVSFAVTYGASPWEAFDIWRMFFIDWWL